MRKITVLLFLFTILGFVSPQGQQSTATESDNKSVTIGTYTLSYNERGEGDTILLLHGFGGRKEQWDLFTKSLIPNYRIIVIDLPGHGNSSKSLDGLYGYNDQVEHLNTFIDKIGLAKFHIVGHSMGGQIAGKFAVKYPERLFSLGLISPGGIISAKRSEFIMRLSKGENILMVKTYEEYNDMLDFVFYKVPPWTESRKKADYQRSLADKEIKKKIGSDLRNSARPFFEYQINEIKTPTLILWGEKDRMQDVSAAAILEKSISDSKAVIMKDMGHVPMVERPGETAEIYIDFLKNL